MHDPFPVDRFPVFSFIPYTPQCHRDLIPLAPLYPHGRVIRYNAGHVFALYRRIPIAREFLIGRVGSFPNKIIIGVADVVVLGDDELVETIDHGVGSLDPLYGDTIKSQPGIHVERIPALHVPNVPGHANLRWDLLDSPPYTRKRNVMGIKSVVTEIYVIRVYTPCLLSFIYEVSLPRG